MPINVDPAGEDESKVPPTSESAIEIEAVQSKDDERRLSSAVDENAHKEFLKSVPYFRQSSTDMPERFLPELAHIAILDQGREGASVGFALAALINLLRNERGERDLVSARMLYQMARQYSGLPPDVAGAYLWSGFLGWQRHGVCLDALWPYRPDRPGALTEAAKDAALKMKPEKIERVEPHADDVRAAVHERHGVVLAAKMHDGWMDVHGPEGLIKPVPGTSQSARHPVLAIGYTEKGILVQNSWGVGWGGPNLDGTVYAGCAIWPIEDFENNVVEAWTAQIPGGVLPEKFREERGRRAGYLPDSVAGVDRLNIGREVESLSMVVASRDVNPPLAIGLFGDWGVGKSFFIKEMQGKLKAFADEARRIEKLRDDMDKSSDGLPNKNALQEPAFWSDIAQIDFNAWHYMDQNLWASIVVRIFDGLAEHVAHKKKGIVHKEREDLLKRIEQKNEQIRILEQARAEVNESINNNQRELGEIDRQIAAKERTLAGLDFGSLALKRWKQFVESNGTLRKTADDLGLPETIEAFADLQAGITEAKSEAAVVRARFAALTSEGKPALRLLLLLGILVGGTLVGLLVIDQITVKNFLTKALGVIASAVTWAGGVAASAAQLLKGVNARIRQVRESFDNIVHDETQEERNQRDAALQELSDLTSRRLTMDDDLANQRKEIAALEKQLEDLRVGRRLYSFIRQRAESAEYRDKLGIIARIREDFQTLSELLAENSQEKRNRWRTDGEGTVVETAETEESLIQSATTLLTRAATEEVAAAVRDATGESDEPQKDKEKDEAGVASIDRIVLYIDDLDRCPPERVVEVLQAVHLLLALKLFVVVVAVDSRWLLRSLEGQYPEFLSLDQEIVGQKEIARWASTPQNYLEKIFQIALGIKPMNEAGYLQLLEDLVGPAVIVVSAERGDRDSESEPGGDRALGVSKPDNLPTASEEETAARKVDPNPPSLEITQHEVDLMRDLSAFLGTPRAVKRFVNTYRIIRASLSPKELHDFEIDNSEDPVAVLVLLALLSGTPMEATWVFQSLDTTPDQVTWDTFVEGLKPQLQEQEASKPTAALRAGQVLYKNAACSKIYPNAVPRWQRIHKALTTYSHISFATVAPLRKWLGRVARCAFYPFRLERD